MSGQPLGTIVDHEGALCLETSRHCYYPLAGNSSVASDFVETFGEAQRGDIGKRVFRQSYGLVMENNAQRDERQARENSK